MGRKPASRWPRIVLAMNSMHLKNKDSPHADDSCASDRPQHRASESAIGSKSTANHDQPHHWMNRRSIATTIRRIHRHKSATTVRHATGSLDHDDDGGLDQAVILVAHASQSDTKHRRSHSHPDSDFPQSPIATTSDPMQTQRQRQTNFMTRSRSWRKSSSSSETKLIDTKDAQHQHQQKTLPKRMQRSFMTLVVGSPSDRQRRDRFLRRSCTSATNFSSAGSIQSIDDSLETHDDQDSISHDGDHDDVYAGTFSNNDNIMADCLDSTNDSKHFEHEDSLLLEDFQGDAGDDSHSVASSAKSVSFGTVSVRTFPQILGDHPYCTSGCPITLDWNHTAEQSTTVDNFESCETGPLDCHRSSSTCSATVTTSNSLRFSYEQRYAIISANNDTMTANELRRQCRKQNRVCQTWNRKKQQRHLSKSFFMETKHAAMQ